MRWIKYVTNKALALKVLLSFWQKEYFQLLFTPRPRPLGRPVLEVENSLRSVRNFSFLQLSIITSITVTEAVLLASFSREGSNERTFDRTVCGLLNSCIISIVACHSKQSVIHISTGQLWFCVSTRFTLPVSFKYMNWWSYKFLKERPEGRVWGGAASPFHQPGWFAECCNFPQRICFLSAIAKGHHSHGWVITVWVRHIKWCNLFPFLTVSNTYLISNFLRATAVPAGTCLLYTSPSPRD